MRRFDLVMPGSLEECIRTLAERGPDAKLVAGGTDLLPQMKSSMLRTSCVVDLSGVSQLRQLTSANGSGLRIGAAVTARTLERDHRVRTAYPAISESGALVGSVQVRNLATLGGNVCNAAPSADMAPPLLALDAEAVIAGPGGTRRVPFASFFLGVRRTALAPGEVLVEIVVPHTGPHSGGSYRRHTPRRELDIAVVGVASQLTLSKGVCAKARIALAALVLCSATQASAQRPNPDDEPGRPEGAQLSVTNHNWLDARLYLDDGGQLVPLGFVMLMWYNPVPEQRRVKVLFVVTLFAPAVAVNVWITEPALFRSTTDTLNGVAPLLLIVVCIRSTPCAGGVKLK